MRIYSAKELLLANLNILPTAIYDAFLSPLFGKVLILAVKAGIFESLHNQPQTDIDIAAALNLHARSTEIFLQSLCATKYLRKRGKKYFLTSQPQKWLVKSSAHYIGNFLCYIDLLHNHWSYLEKTIKAGKPPSSYVDTFTPDEWEIYTLGMMDLAKLTFPYLIKKMNIPSTAKMLLDLGGSHGYYAIEFCKRHPSLQATIADFAPVLSITENIVRDQNLNHRITLQPCDLTTTRFPSERYDIVFAFNIVHGLTTHQNREFFKSIGSTLTTGGIVYILDQYRDDATSGVAKMLPLMVGLNLMNEIGGTVYSPDEVRSWCNEGGLSNVKYRKLQLPGLGLIRAEKSNG